MWRDVVGIVKRVIEFVRATERNRDEIKEMQQRLEDLTGIVVRQAYEIQLLRETERLEREKMRLQIETDVLRSQQRALKSKGDDEH